MLNTGPLIAPVQPRLRKYPWLWITEKKTYNSFSPLLWVHCSTDRRRNRAFLKCFLPVERVVTSSSWKRRRLGCVSVVPCKKKSPNTKSVSMVITKIVSLSICTGTLPSRVGRTQTAQRGKGSLVFELRFVFKDLPTTLFSHQIRLCHHLDFQSRQNRRGTLPLSSLWCKRNQASQAAETERNTERFFHQIVQSVGQGGQNLIFLSLITCSQVMGRLSRRWSGG